MFTANPLPDLSKSWAPTKNMSSPTRLAPFNLQTEVRGEKHANKWKKEVRKISCFNCWIRYYFSCMQTFTSCDYYATCDKLGFELHHLYQQNSLKSNDCGVCVVFIGKGEDVTGEGRSRI